MPQAARSGTAPPGAARVDDEDARPQYLPPSVRLQELADSSLTTRNQISYSVVTLGVCGLLAWSVLGSSNQVVEWVMLIGYYVFPLCCVVLIAAIAPMAPPIGSLKYLSAACLAGAMGSARLAQMRHEQFYEGGSALECSLRVGLAIMFATLLLGSAALFSQGRQDNAALFWPLLRTLLAARPCEPAGRTARIDYRDGDAQCHQPQAYRAVHPFRGFDGHTSVGVVCRLDHCLRRVIVGSFQSRVSWPLHLHVGSEQKEKADDAGKH